MQMRVIATAGDVVYDAGPLRVPITQANQANTLAFNHYVASSLALIMGPFCPETSVERAGDASDPRLTIRTDVMSPPCGPGLSDRGLQAES